MSITSKTILETEFGPFTVHYHKTQHGDCVSFSSGVIEEGTPILRIHSACLFGEAFSSVHCDCYHQLTQTLKIIVEEGGGAIVYSYQEGRGIGLEKKIAAMEIQRTEKCDTVDAFQRLGFQKSDLRNYNSEIQALRDLAFSKTLRLFSGSPKKAQALKRAEYKITEMISTPDKHFHPLAVEERKTKEKKLGYSYR